ncbi:MAG: efflux RND transporter periplasmic adaptor subunit [Nitrospirota bacterium]
MQRSIVFISTIVVFLVFVSCAKKEDEKKASLSKETVVKAIPVEVGQITIHKMQDIVYTLGTIAPSGKANVGASVSGRIEMMHVREGSIVKAGDVIAEIKSTEFQIQYDAAKDRLALAESDYQRKKRLFEAGAITKGERDIAEDRYKQAKAQYELAEQQMAHARVTAPITGVIGAKLFDKGEVVGAGMPIVNIMNTSKVNVESDIPENEVYKIREGQWCQVISDAYTGKVFSGKVVNIAPLADPLSRTFKTKIEIDNPQMLLHPGMFARVTIVVGEKPKARVVPIDAVIEREGSEVIFVVRANEANLIKVKTGLKDNKFVELLNEDLKMGEQVIVQGHQNLKDKDKVSIVTKK